MPFETFEILDNDEDLFCRDCGMAMIITVEETAHHVDSDGGIDYDADADHVAISDNGDPFA